MQFGVFIHTGLQPGDRQMIVQRGSRFNGFRTNYEGKPLKRFFVSKTHC
jgi:hypothetical protein